MSGTEITEGVTAQAPLDWLRSLGDATLPA